MVQALRAFMRLVIEKVLGKLQDCCGCGCMFKSTTPVATIIPWLPHDVYGVLGA